MTFDLEKARTSISHYRIENHSNVDTESAIKELVDQANLAEECLDEIERLRADLEQSEICIRAKGGKVAIQKLAEALNAIDLGGARP